MKNVKTKTNWKRYHVIKNHDNGAWEIVDSADDRELAQDLATDWFRSETRRVDGVNIYPTVAFMVNDSERIVTWDS